jgi:anti-anti-sigma factor
MGLDIQIGEQGSAIVVTVSGSTDLAALEPLSSAILAAASGGRTVVVDLDDVAELDTKTLGGFLGGIESASDQIRLVAHSPNLRELIGQASSHQIMVCATVAAALDGNRRREGHDEPSDGPDRGDPPQGGEAIDVDPVDLREKFAQLESQYRVAISRCRDLLQSAEGLHRQDASS